MPLRIAFVLSFLYAPASLYAQSFDPATLFAQAAASAPMTLTFGEGTVKVAGATPGGETILFSVAHEAGPWSVRVVRRAELLEDTDGDGSMELELGQSVARRSIWVAVDLASGGHAAAAPGDYPLRKVEAPPGLLLPRIGVLPDRLRDLRRSVELLVVRPATGAWRITSGDDGPEDEDGEANGEVVSALDRLQRLGDGPDPPDRLNPGDLLVMIDPDQLEFYVARLAAPPL